MIHKYNLNKKYEYFKESLLNIKNIFNSSSNTIHKARNELKIIEIEGTRYVIKSFKVPHLLNRIAYTFFREGKAKKSYLNAVKLQELGVNTPEPVGVIEFFQNGLLTQSYFVSLYEPYDFTIREVFRHQVDNIQEILYQFSKFTFNVHQKGIWHVDYSSGNILITQKENNDYKFSLVDINRMQFKRITPELGLTSFSKFWSSEEDLKTMVKVYAKLSNLKFSSAYNIAYNAYKKVQNKKRMKSFFKTKK